MPTQPTATSAAIGACPRLPRPVDVEAARGLKNTTFDGVIDITSSASSTVAWAMSVHLLAPSLLCPKCTTSMRLDVGHERWRCSRAACRTERSIRTNSFFSKSKLPLRKLVRLLCHWCARTPVTAAAVMVGVNAQAAMQWYTYCRDICSQEMMSIPMEIGGEGHVVEIDETSLKKKSKYNRGRRYPDFWLFGGVERTTNRWFGILTYEDRTKPTLSAVIKKHIRPK
ncbi:putative ISXO2-like transposase domain-containing protein [Phytophthora infestans]|uniref:Putative ISXO2-like transposase domain-containing protein n=1 Tax=Phytophthora infestans TaxID=4787 RepID=A0A8S9VEN1_PHYIN|nr:putative ISXO2-like transposase domain-containing protein [Phytophthora infestans]